MPRTTEKNKILLNARIFLPLIITFSFFFLGWGYIGHRIINYNTIFSALPNMPFFDTWAGLLADHASDADNRKSSDSTEKPKHYIDIDNYPEFISTGTILQNYDSLVSKYGLTFVIAQGTLPWAILNTTDSLQDAFARNDMNKAMLFAADLGHYIADSHMPLHITKNFDGQYIYQNGVHSRYETNLIGQFQNQIIYGGDSLKYIDNLPDYIFNMLYDNYAYVDSVLYADATAKTFAGNNVDGVYYNKLWEISKNYTIDLFKKASYKLACVIYTAWINAGGSPAGITKNKNNLLSGFSLTQNYPNPFNPSTMISYKLPIGTVTTLKVFNILGKEVTTLVDEYKASGDYEMALDAEALPSGVYFYQLKAGDYLSTKKMILLK
jgi:hypothetical protein